MIKLIVIIILVVGGGIAAFYFFGWQEAVDQIQNTNEITAIDVVSGTAALKIKKNTDKDLAVIKAQELWRIAVLSGEDLSSGPCLTNEAIPGWVADIAHNPRQPVDDLPANQCSAYRDGTAKHFVELDAEGQLIRAE